MNIEEIKLKWQKHNRDHGMSWNEVASLVNELTQPAASEKPIIEQIVLNVLDGMVGIGGIPGNEDFCNEFDMRLRGAMDVAQPRAQPAASEDDIIHIMRIGLEYITDADGMGRFFGERETAKAIIQSLNVQGDAQQRYEKALQYVERAVHIDGELDQDKALRIAAGLKEGGQG